MKKIISLCLALVLLLAVLVGCVQTPGNPDDPTNPTINKTDIKIVDGGKTEYKVVVPSGENGFVTTAASELVNFVKEATGATLPVVMDGEEFSVSAKVISLGNTTVFESSGVKLTEKLRETGYVMKRKGNTLIINAKDDNGVVSAVYDMLGYSLGLEFYSYDEYSLDKTDTMYMLDFDLEFVPSIDIRDIMMRSLNTNYRQRMRLYAGKGLGQWITFAHTTTGASNLKNGGDELYGFLPYSVYGKNEDWYDESHTQLCYSNAEMRVEFVEQVKKRIIKNPDGKYLMIGHEDNFNMCMCDDCKAERDLYGGYGGQELHFTNLVAEAVDAWLADNYPDREIFYVFFAYQTSQEPPIKRQTIDGKEVGVKDADGKYIPHYGDLKIRKNVMVMYCPIDADFSKKFSETENATQYTQLKGWSDLFAAQGLANNIIVWGYSLAVYNYFIPLYNFGTYKAHYEFYRECGVHYIDDQAYSSSGIPCFEAMQIYVQSKLMYDTSLSYNDLCYDFIEHYYGPSGETFKEYFDFFRTYYEYLAETKSINGSIWQEMSKAEYWPTEVVQQLMDYLDKCIEDIQPLKQTDYARWQLLNDRLRRERLTPIYMMFMFHMNELPKDKQVEYLADMKMYTQKYDILETQESKRDITTLIETWETQIGG